MILVGVAACASSAPAPAKVVTPRQVRQAAPLSAQETTQALVNMPVRMNEPADCESCEEAGPGARIPEVPVRRPRAKPRAASPRSVAPPPAPPEPAPAPAPESPPDTSTDEDSPVLDHIYFAHNDTKLEGVTAQLEAVARLALTSDAEGLVLLIIGHADPQETMPERLSLERANAVHGQLVALGVSAQRMRIQALGDAQPSAAAGSQSSRNRRVEIRVRR